MRRRAHAALLLVTLAFAGAGLASRVVAWSRARSTAVAANSASERIAPPVATRAAPCLDVAGCEDGCARGEGAACNFAGRGYERGEGVPVDLARAFARYEAACDRGDAPGCYSAASLLEAGRGAPRDLPRALGLYERVCEAGSHIACGAVDRLKHTR